MSKKKNPGERLQTLLRLANVTQEAAARAVELSPTAFRAILKGRSAPKLRTAFLLEALSFALLGSLDLELAAKLEEVRALDWLAPSDRPSAASPVIAAQLFPAAATA